MGLKNVNQENTPVCDVMTSDGTELGKEEHNERRDNDQTTTPNITDSGVTAGKELPDIFHPDAKKQLQEIIQQKGIVDYTLDIESGSAKGDNYLGVITKANINGKTKSGDSISLNWIIKSPPTSETIRELTKIELAYQRECVMYEKVLPYFENFQREKCATHPFDSTVPFVMSYLEPPKEILVMEDMKALGYIMKDRKQPLDYNHVKLVMEAYGKLHAVSYALKDQRPEEFKKLAEQAQEWMFTRSTVEYEELSDHHAKYNTKVLKSLDPIQDAHACELFKKYASKTVDLTLESMDLTKDSPYSVIGHGDSWVNNMLFKYDDQDHFESPTKVCLLDWQLARYGSPAFDLSYFIFACTDKPLRDKYYDQMIKVYYYSLCSHLVDLGSNPEKIITFENLQDELKRYSFFGMQMSITVVYLMLSESEEVPDYDCITNQDDLMHAFTYESKNESRYLERVRGIVLDFVDNGYLDFL